MPLQITARYWSPTAPTSLPGNLPRGSRFQPRGFEVRLGQFVSSDADPGVLHLSLDPDPSDPVRSYSALDLTGSWGDFRNLIDQLQSYVDINAPQEIDEPNIAANDRLVRVLAAIDRAAIVSKRAAGTVAADLLALANPTTEAVAGVLYYTGSKGGKAAALSVAPSILAALTEAEA